MCYLYIVRLLGLFGCCGFYFSSFKSVIMTKSFKNGYSVSLSNSSVSVRFNGETIKCIDVNPNYAVEKFNEIAKKVSSFGTMAA
tara:strand:- start:162 stop:413 length:252 start_codon:yes stop_codon:yes gene_type:complete